MKQRRTKRPPGRGSRRPFRVLLIEDNDDHALLLAEGLRAHAAPVQIQTAVSLDAGLVQCEGNAYDLVILDAFLGNRSMIGQLAKVRRQIGATPLMVVAGSGDETLAVEAVKRGATEYIVKNREGLERLPGLFRAYRRTPRRLRTASVPVTTRSPTGNRVARQLVQTIQRVEALAKQLRPGGRGDKRRTDLAPLLQQLKRLRTATTNTPRGNR